MCIAVSCSKRHAGDPGDGADPESPEGNPAQALDILNSAIESEDGYIRYYSAVLLGSTGDKRATASLIEALDDPDPVVRRAAARSLGSLGDERAVQPLVAALRDRDFQVKTAAAGALERMGWTPQGEEEARHYDLVKWEIGERARIDTTTVVPLVEALRAEESHKRFEAVSALEELGWKPANESQRLSFILAKGEIIPYRGEYSDPMRKAPLYAAGSTGIGSQREKSKEDSISIAAGTELKTGFIALKTKPAAAMRFYIDGRELVCAHEAMIEAPAGKHRIDAEDDLYRYYARPSFVEVRERKKAKVTIELEDLFPPLSKVEMVDLADRHFREEDLYDIEVVRLWRLSRTKYIARISYRIKDRWYYLWESKPERMASVDKPETIFLFSLEGFDLEERNWDILAVFTP
jgi:hypothetical protein